MCTSSGLQACLCFEDSAGLTLPTAPWPRLAAAVGAAADAEFPPPWDVLLAHALVDVSEGGGDAFTTAYVDALLPRPRALALPFCQDATALAALQHPRVADAALERRQLLERDFPDVNTSYLGARFIVVQSLEVWRSICTSKICKPGLSGADETGSACMMMTTD